MATKTTIPLPLSMKGFKFGCDPEFFIVNADGKPVCPDFLPGTKAEPHKVEFGAVQRDGMAAEINIDPVDTFDDWDRNITEVIRQLRGMLPKGHKPLMVPAVEFDPDLFDAAPDDAKELGCSPDFNAWTGEVNSPPSAPDNPYLRCAGGHLHVGWTEGADLGDIQHTMNCRDLARQFDWYLAGWSLRIDKDPTRRLLYGKAGAYRPKEYGAEYRTLSNFWIESKEKRMIVWNRMQQAIADMRTKFMPDLLSKDWQDLLVASINNSQLSPQLEQSVRYPIVTLSRAPIF